MCEGNSSSIHKIISNSTLVCALLGSTFKVFIYYRKNIATPDCFAPYLVNVPTKEDCSICLETAIISKELRVKV